jgi:ferredoxin
MAAKVNVDLCTGCGECADNCPAEAIRIQDGKARVNAEACVECEICVSVCPTGAISME